MRSCTWWHNCKGYLGCWFRSKLVNQEEKCIEEKITVPLVLSDELQSPVIDIKPKIKSVICSNYEVIEPVDIIDIKGYDNERNWLCSLGSVQNDKDIKQLNAKLHYDTGISSSIRVSTVTVHTNKDNDTVHTNIDNDYQKEKGTVTRESRMLDVKFTSKVLYSAVINRPTIFTEQRVCDDDSVIYGSGTVTLRRKTQDTQYTHTEGRKTRDDYTHIHTHTHTHTERPSSVKHIDFKGTMASIPGHTHTQKSSFGSDDIQRKSYGNITHTRTQRKRKKTEIESIKESKIGIITDDDIKTKVEFIKQSNTLFDPNNTTCKLNVAEYVRRDILNQIKAF
eukprot:GHVR01009500.1.p1 GENE.GHVR01009500.1~~GHVR01009500.1.p1  ORF type:complete len:336 (+),score=100.36 GHVR01009500.1:45-1052(+)